MLLNFFSVLLLGNLGPIWFFKIALGFVRMCAICATSVAMVNTSRHSPWCLMGGEVFVPLADVIPNYSHLILSSVSGNDIPLPCGLSRFACAECHSHTDSLAPSVDLWNSCCLGYYCVLLLCKYDCCVFLSMMSASQTQKPPRPFEFFWVLPSRLLLSVQRGKGLQDLPRPFFLRTQVQGRAVCTSGKPSLREAEVTAL